MSDDRLFDVPELVAVTAHRTHKTYTAELRGVTVHMETAMQAANAARGLHPTSGYPLAPEGTGTCGDCGLMVRHGYKKTFLKCSAVPVLTHGPATDVRAFWPACSRWAPSPDAGPGMLVSELLGTDA